MAVISIVGSDTTQIMGSSALQINNKVTNMEGYATGGSFGVLSNIASAVETELTTTSATTITSFTPSATGFFLVMIYFRVVTAATTVTVSITYNDVTGAQTLTPVNAISEPIGSYTNMVSICATNAAAITVSVTAGTANQVYASAAIVAL